MTSLPANWTHLTPSDAQPLEAELERELSPTHLLFGRELRAIARRDGYDDVLFTPAEGITPVYWVHLTWAVETDPAWPWTKQYTSLVEFIDDWAKENPGTDDEDAG
jgi:hypothetical protein